MKSPIIELFFAGFAISGFLMGYGLCLIRHRHAINIWRESKNLSAKWLEFERKVL